MKETKYIDLEKLQTFPEEFFMAKMDVESGLEQEDKKSLVDFITALNMTNVYVSNNQMVSFSIKEGNQCNYVFYNMMRTQLNANDENSTLQDTAFNKFKEKLSSISYDLSNLSKKTSYELIANGPEIIEHGEYFVIGNEFYI